MTENQEVPFSDTDQNRERERMVLVKAAQWSKPDAI
jgi:hypothetical protein